MWYNTRRNIVACNNTRKNTCPFCKRGIDYVVLSAQSLVSAERPAAFLVFPVAHFLLSVLGMGTRASDILRDYTDSSVPVCHLAHTSRGERWQPQCNESGPAL